MRQLFRAAKAMTGVVFLCMVAACTAPTHDHHTEINAGAISKWLAENDPPYKAHWVSRELIMMPAVEGHAPYMLASFRETHPVNPVPDHLYKLTATSLPEGIVARFPHLADFAAYRIDVPDEEIAQLIKNEILLIAVREDGSVDDASYVQIPGLLDDLFTSGANDADEVTDLGAVMSAQGVSFKLWAPTARRVAVRLYDADFSPAQNVPQRLPMAMDAKTGIWQADTGPQADRLYYRYEVELYHPVTGKIETLEV